MKTNSFLILTLALALFISSCGKENIRASKTTTTEDFDLTDFTEMEVSDDFKAYITFIDSEESVSIKASKNLHEHIIVEMINDKLFIGLKQNICIKGNETLEAYINATKLSSFDAKDDSQIILENTLEADEVTINLTSDSKMEGSIDVEELNVDLTGDSKLVLRGTADELTAKLTSDSQLKDYYLIVEDLTLDMTGDCETYLTVNNTINISGSGDCIFHFKGDAVIEQQNLSGDSKIKFEG